MESRKPHRADGGGVIGRSAPAFNADPAHVTWFGSRILKAVSSKLPHRVLDIGCGDGAVLLLLAEALPAALLVGVDISSENIGLAAMAIDRSPHRDRIRLVHGDYVTLDAGRFDLVVSSSALQSIGSTTERLAESIARDVAPFGHPVHVTPYRCRYTSVPNAVRTV